MAYPIQSMADGRVRMSDGTIQEAPNTFSSGTPISNINQRTMPELYPTAFPNVKGFSQQPQAQGPMSVAPQEQTFEQPQQQEQTQQEQQQQQVPELLIGAGIDILNGMPIEQLPKLYPELSGTDTSVLKELASDIKKGMPISEAPKLYPKLFPEGSINIPQTPQEQPPEEDQGVFSKLGESFVESAKNVAGIAEKTGQEIYRNASDIGSNIYKATSGEIKADEAAVRTLNSIFGIATAPISGVLGQEAETFQKLPESVRNAAIESVKQALPYGTEQAATTVEQWYNAQPDEVKKDISRIGAGLELAGNLAGLKLAPKVAESTMEGITKAGKVTGNIAGEVGEKIADVAETIPEGLKKTGKAVSKKAEELFDQTIVGIEPSKKAGFQSNPYQKEYFEEMINKADSAEGIGDIKNVQEEMFSRISDDVQKSVAEKVEALGENAPVYRTIRELPTEIDANEVVSRLEKSIYDSGLTIEDGIVKKNPAIKTTAIANTDVSKVNDLYQGIVADARKQGGKLSTSNILDSRHNVDKLIKYDRIMSSDDGQNLLRSMRGGIDDVAKRDIPGLIEIDKNFVDKLGEYGEATRDLIYKQGDNKGEFRSNLNAIISNLNTPNRALLKARLEESIPGLSERVQAVRNLSELHKAIVSPTGTSKIVGAGAGASSGFALGLTTLGPIGAGIGALAGGILGANVEKAVIKAKISRLKNIVGNMSSKGKERLVEINKKIESNKTLRKEEKEMIDRLKSFVDSKKEVGKKEVLMLEAPKQGAKGRMLSTRKPNVVTQIPEVIYQGKAKPEITEHSKIVNPQKKKK